MRLELNYHQSGVIPYRKNGKKKLEILLITSVKKQRWIIPKGYVEFNLFVVQKSFGKCLIKIFSMEVIKELDDYPEKTKRKRKWFDIDDAVKKVKVKEVSGMIALLNNKLK